MPSFLLLSWRRGHDKLYSMKTVVSFCLLMATISIFAQSKKNIKNFHFSLSPGFGSNGIHPGSFSNIVAVNLTSGYSGASYLFEFAGVSNLNTTETRGLQIAGLTNITGGNAFAGMLPKEKERKIREGFEANLTGIQLAGVSNYVLNNVFGAQLSGGLNISNGALEGIQVAGRNTAAK